MNQLMGYVASDPELSKALFSGSDLNEDQALKFANLMLRVPYFQDQLIAAVSSKPDDAWIANLPKKAQVRFVRIITSVKPSQLEDEKVQSKLIKKLLKDKDIGPALKAKFGDDVDAEVIKRIS